MIGHCRLLIYGPSFRRAGRRVPRPVHLRASSKPKYRVRSSRARNHPAAPHTWDRAAAQIAFSVLVFTETPLVPIEGWTATVMGRVRLSRSAAFSLQWHGAS